MNQIEIKSKAAQHKFESYGFVEDNHYYWWASWYALVLGYKSKNSLKNCINKSKRTCVVLGANVEDNFIPSKLEGKKDIKLTKFACFLIALHADERKPVVKRARAYFLNELEDLNHLLTDEQYLSRTTAREEIKFLNKKLSKAARRAHVKDFQYFINEGYMGMYNRTMSEIKDARGVPQQKDMNDYMSNTELAANIFRISLTIERLGMIRNPSQAKAAREHWKIGDQIRNMVSDTLGNPPERLPILKSLKDLQKKLIKSQNELNKALVTTSNKSIQE